MMYYLRLQQKLGQWTLIITLELTLTMNNKVASCMFSYFRLTRDVWVWHCHVSCLVSWHYSGHCILWWSWPVPMSWYVTLLSFWFVFTRVWSWSSFLLGHRCSMFQKIEFSSFSVCLIHQIKLGAITQARGLPPQPTSAHPTSRASLGTSPGQWAPPA